MKLRTVMVLAIFVAACDLDVPDLNNPGVGLLLSDPTPARVSATATGLVVGNREGYAETNGYITILGVLGREAYNFDPNDPRFIETLLAGELSPGDGVFGGNFWNLPYANLNMANILLSVIPDTVYSEAEQTSLRGFARTMQALDYLVIANTREINGGVRLPEAQLPDPDNLAPLVSQADLFTHIKSLLDNGRDDLQAAGGIDFPFPLPSGFDGFDTPATFLQFNRAIKARADVYSGDYEEALVSLGDSFLVVDAANPQLDRGVYHSYGTDSGDRQNELGSLVLVAHPSITMDAQEGDKRVAEKVVTLEQTATNGTGEDALSTDFRYAMYSNLTSPAPIIRNEELILLRAEANFMLGNLDAAILDIDHLRVHSGGLEARGAELTMDNFVDELLYQRRFGLLFEGHRWLDMRRFNRLDQLPKDRDDDVIHVRFPIPSDECNARPADEPFCVTEGS